MIEVIKVSIEDAKNSKFPLDEVVMSKANEDLKVLQEKRNVIHAIDSAVKNKTFAKLHLARDRASKFREMHGLAHTASMDEKSRQVDVLLKLRLFEQDLTKDNNPTNSNAVS